MENKSIIPSGSTFFGDEYVKYISPDTTLIYTDSSIVTSTEELYRNSNSAIAKTVVVLALAFMSYNVGTHTVETRTNLQVENTNIINLVAYDYIRKQEEYLNSIYNVIEQPVLLDVECEEAEFVEVISSGHFMSEKSVDVINISNDLFAESKPMVGKELELLLKCISTNSPSKPSLPNRL